MEFPWQSLSGFSLAIDLETTSRVRLSSEDSLACVSGFTPTVQDRVLLHRSHGQPCDVVSLLDQLNGNMTSAARFPRRGLSADSGIAR